MKRFLVLSLGVLFTVTIAAYSLDASPKVLKHMKNGKKVHFAMKDGKRVNSCAYCHAGTGIAKKKQGYLKGQPNYKKLGRMAKCAGSGCHK